MSLPIAGTGETTALGPPHLQRMLLHALFEHMPVGIAVVEAPSGRIAATNAHLREILRVSTLALEDVGEYGQWSAYHPDGRPLAPEEWPAIRALRTGQHIPAGIYQIARADGTSALLRVSAAPLRDESGAVTAAVATIVDVTNEVMAQRDLQLLAERFRLIERATNDVVYDWDLVTGVLSWNDAIHTTFGYTPGEVRPDITWWSDQVHPDDRERLTTSLHAALDGDDTLWSAEYRFRRGDDGSYADVYERGYVQRDEAGRPIRMIGALADITERKRMERALRVSEASHRALVEALPALVYRAHPTPPYSTIFVSPGVAALGYTVEEWIERPDRWISLLHPDDAPWVLAETEAAFAEGRSVEYEYRMIAKDGAVRWFHDRGEFLRDAQGRAVVWQGIMVDITARREAEDRLRMQAHLLAAVEQAVIATDLRGLVTFWNRFAERLYGWTAAEAVGRHIGDLLLPPEVRHLAEEQLEPLRRGESHAGEQQLVRKDGSRFWAAVSASPLMDASGRVTGMVGSSNDVSARRALEEQLRQSQKMEAVGRLAGGIAHDFNNLLTVIGGHAELLRAEMPSDSPHAPDVRAIHDAAKRAASLTGQLLAFSRQQVLEPRRLDLAAVIAESEHMLRRLIGEDIEIVMRCPRGIGHVVADAGQLTQVLLNLAVNARDAMPGGGTLTIEVSRVELEGSAAMDYEGPRPGPHVVLAVTDTGHGMDAATRSRIFEPFFTTKEPGKGTGLGLSTVYGIVKQSGGAIRVESGPGRGAAFRIYLPCVEAGPETTSGPMPAIRPRRHAATVLLVEDEDAVRVLTRRVLEEQGYSVIEARHGVEALELAVPHAGHIDLLVTDAVMPHISGPELARRLRDRIDGLRVIIVSGYTDDELLRRGELAPGTAFLRKPFSPRDLARLVREVLERPVAAAD